MTKWLKDDQGRFTGSIGEGRSAPTMPTTPLNVKPIADAGSFDFNLFGFDDVVSTAAKTVAVLGAGVILFASSTVMASPAEATDNTLTFNAGGSVVATQQVAANSQEVRAGTPVVIAAKTQKCVKAERNLDRAEQRTEKAKTAKSSRAARIATRKWQRAVAVRCATSVVAVTGSARTPAQVEALMGQQTWLTPAQSKNITKYTEIGKKYTGSFETFDTSRPPMEMRIVTEYQWTVEGFKQAEGRQDILLAYGKDDSGKTVIAVFTKNGGGTKGMSTNFSENELGFSPLELRFETQGSGANVHNVATHNGVVISQLMNLK